MGCAALLLLAACGSAPRPSAATADSLAVDAVQATRSRPTMPAGPCALPRGENYGGLSEGATDWSLSIRPAGLVKIVALFLDFPDAPAAADEKFGGDQGIRDVERWYRASSRGVVDLRITSVRRWIRMPRASTAYRFDADDRSAMYMQDAIAAADPVVNFRGARAVYLVPTEAAEKVTTTSYAQVFSLSLPPRADGVDLARAVTFGRGAFGSPSVIAHETGHLFGLPDLYPVRREPESADQFHDAWVGPWDVMATGDLGQDLLAWHKWKLGWLGPAQVACVSERGKTSHLLTPVERRGGPKLVVVRTSATSVLVAEVRDGSLAGEGSEDWVERGVLVYSVDSTTASGAGPVRIRPARQPRDAPQPYLEDAPYDLGPDETARHEDASALVTIDLVRKIGGAYLLTVTKS